MLFKLFADRMFVVVGLWGKRGIVTLLSNSSTYETTSEFSF